MSTHIAGNIASPKRQALPTGTALLGRDDLLFVVGKYTKVLVYHLVLFSESEPD